MSEELDLLRKIAFGSLSEQQLVDIYFSYKDEYRILLNLAMHPRFPSQYAINIVPRLFAVDLVRLIKNKRTRPETRKKAELEFFYKYPRFPLGEKLSYMKIAPPSLMEYFIEEKDKQIIEVMLNNQLCTEELVLKFINRKESRAHVYEVLIDGEWYKRSRIAEAIAYDNEAPIRVLISILPYMSKPSLRKLYENPETHAIVKKNIIEFLKNRRKTVG